MVVRARYRVTVLGSDPDQRSPRVLVPADDWFQFQSIRFGIERPDPNVLACLHYMLNRKRPILGQYILSSREAEHPVRALAGSDAADR
jgi:hypothetical protein